MRSAASTLPPLCPGSMTTVVPSSGPSGAGDFVPSPPEPRLSAEVDPGDPGAGAAEGSGVLPPETAEQALRVRAAAAARGAIRGIVPGRAGLVRMMVWAVLASLVGRCTNLVAPWNFCPL